MITGNDIIKLGFSQGPIIKVLLEKAKELEKQNFSKEAILEELQKTPKETPKIDRKEFPSAYTEAILAESFLDRKTIQDVRVKMDELLLTPVVVSGAIMPDTCIAGNEEATIPVGGCIAVKNAIIPASHSSDLCCSMFSSFFYSDLPTNELMDCLHASTRFGGGGRSPENYVHHPVLDEPVWDNPFLKGLKPFAIKHMADQGDGNHFAYLGNYTPDETTCNSLEKARYNNLAITLNNPYKVLVTHHGSRGLGAQVYKRGVQCAMEMTDKIANNIPKNAAWIPYDSPEGQNYWEAIQYVARWTKANHEAIHKIFSEKAGFEIKTSFGNAHNFIWKQNNDIFLHGKGATPAWNDQFGRPLLGLIPLNMGAEILIVLGKNNGKYLSFAPHGAGRNLSRTETSLPFKDSRGILKMKVKEAIEDATHGLDIRWYCGEPDISESPIGYKNAKSIRSQIEHFDLAEVIATIQPLGCIMAGVQNMQFFKKKKKSKPQPS